MGRSQQTFMKKEKEKKRIQKAKDKAYKKEIRKSNAVDGNDLSLMIAYVDENGNLSSTPPPPPTAVKGKAVK